MLPPGTRAVVYETPHNRTSWGPQGLDSWYCGLLFNHYRNMRFFVPETKSYQTSVLYDLFPKHCVLPELNDKQHTDAVMEELIESLQRLKNKHHRNAITKVRRHIETIVADRQLPTREGVVVETEGGAPPAEGVTTTTNPTNPRVLA